MGSRLFVSIDLPEHLHESVAAVQEPFETIPGVRATDPTQAHVTLKFLGDVEDERIDTVAEALDTAVANADVAPFTARYGNLGVFPEFDYISVIWLGVPAGGTAMERLHESIETETVELGFDPESHEFTPHVTIARMDHGEGKETVQELLQERDPSVGEMTVDHVSLTESIRTPDGPRYETVDRVPLS